MTARRAVGLASTHVRRLGSKTEATSHLLELLRRNPELSEEDAKAELRWMRQAAPIRPEDGSTEHGRLKAMVERRSRGEPLQYILGDTDFGPLTILCRPPTLIPRPETAHVFARLAETIRAQRPSPALRIADLCTGTGCIPLLLRHLLGPAVHLMGYDLSPDAIELAKENARALDLDAGFHELDVFHPSAAEQVVQHSGGRVGVLVSNPPYIPLHEYRALPASVRSYEDPRALLGDPSGYEGDGLAFYRRIADLLPDVLRSEEEMDRDGLGGLPRVAVEIGAEQGKAVEEILRSSPGGVVRRTEVWVDQYDRDRAVVGWAC